MVTSRLLPEKLRSRAPEGAHRHAYQTYIQSCKTEATEHLNKHTPFEITQDVRSRGQPSLDLSWAQGSEPESAGLNSEAEQSGKTSLTGGSQDGSSVSPDPSFWHTPEL